MSKIEEHLGQFESGFAKELTPSLAASYVASLTEKLGGTDQPFDQFVANGVELHKFVGEKLYGPLIVGCVQWMAEKCAEIGHQGTVYFALRDAAPLQTAAHVLWNGSTLNPVEIYANRPMLGVDDEIAPEKSEMNGQVMQYLGLMGLANQNKIVWADTGAWGTVVKALKLGLLAEKDFFPLFWYSHNPNIPGFLNGLLPMAGLEDKFGEKLNDSVECMFPQPHLRPLEIEFVQWGPRVKLLPSNYLSEVWGEAALYGVKLAALKFFKDGPISKSDQIGHLKMLSKLSDDAKTTGKWKGVLSVNTPTWSDGKKFLAEWPVKLLP